MILLRVEDLTKAFTLHLRGGLRIPVLDGVSFEVGAGECVALNGPSGAGKSTLLRCLYGNYEADTGSIHVRHDGEMLDLAQADPRTVIELRARTIGYVSQFLRVVPRVPAIDVVAEPMLASGLAPAEARERAANLLTRLSIPARLHGLPPATFSGGEQQRINLARGFASLRPILLLDEPTASLDAANSAVVQSMIRQACDDGVAVVGIFHDDAVRAAVAHRTITLAALDHAA